MFDALDRLPVPAHRPRARRRAGGGTGLAAVCDIVVAEPRRVFGFTEVKLGIVPSVISPFVLAKIGRSAARELFLTGARFDAARAQGDRPRARGGAGRGTRRGGRPRTSSEILSAGPEAVRTAKALIRERRGPPASRGGGTDGETLADRRVSARGSGGPARVPREAAPHPSALDGWTRVKSSDAS